VKDSFTSTVLRIVTPTPVKAVIIRLERFAKVGAEAGCQRHLKARQRINHQAFGADLPDRVENLVHGFIHREVEGRR